MRVWILKMCSCHRGVVCQLFAPACERLAPPVVVLFVFRINPCVFQCKFLYGGKRIEAIGMVQRAITILEKQVAGGASIMQLQSAINLEQALEVVATASAISVVDGSELIVMLQSSSDGTDSEAGAFGAAAYDSHSGGIVDKLNGLLEKAEGQFDAANKVETPAKNNDDLFKQSSFDDPRRLQRTSKHWVLHIDYVTEAQDFGVEARSRGV